MEGQGDEVPFPIGLLAIVEDQTVGVVGHENDCHADLLTADTAQEAKKWNLRF